MKKRIILGAARAVGQLNVGIHAAAASFFLILSVFPALMLVLSLLRFTGLQAQALTEFVEGFVPGALMGYVRRLIFNTYDNSSGTILSLSAVTALWSASRGVYGILTGFNAIYEVPENRGYFKTRAVSMVYTVLFIAVLLLTLAVSVFGTTILEMLPKAEHPVISFVWNLIDLRFVLMLTIQTLLFTTMYAVLPGRRNRFLDSFPGAVLASLGWLVFSDLFSLYVENFSRYSNIFGSVYAVALSMLWLYCCISIVFYGAVVNRGIIALRQRKKR